MFTRKDKPSSKSPPAAVQVTNGSNKDNVTVSAGPVNISFGNGSQQDDGRPISPTKMSRLDEKNALIQYNNRLAAILDRNRELESENSKLNGQLQSAEQTLTVTTNKLKQTFENENSDLRKRLENSEKDKVKLDLNAGNLLKDLNDAKNKLQLKEKEISDAANKIRNQDTSITNLNLELKKLGDAADKNAADRKAALDEAAGLKKALDEIRKKLEAEALAKVGLESQLRTKGEELALKKQVHEQEVSVLLTKKQSELEAVGGKLEKEYQIKFEEAIRQLREDCNKQIRANKQDQENLYNMKEDNLKRQSEKTKAALKEKADELTVIMKKLNEFEKKILIIDGERHNLQAALKDAERKWAEDRNAAEKERRGLEMELDAMQDDKEKLINEYQDLMEVKVALDNELATYRKLLEGEEDRLKIKVISGVKKITQELEKQIIT